ncbi:hypothetical protein GYA19_02290 [Candidatus Beckwithbacteria bacterium]|nr:hypothetical protein [Candidatus Beckwithbacteria bacterium]
MICPAGLVNSSSKIVGGSCMKAQGVDNLKEVGINANKSFPNSVFIGLYGYEAMA